VVRTAHLASALVVAGQFDARLYSILNPLWRMGQQGKGSVASGGGGAYTLCVFAAKPRMARLGTPSPRVSWAHPDSGGLRADKISKVERLVSALVSAGTRKLPLQLPSTNVAWPAAKTLREPCRPKRDNHHQQGVSRLERQLSSLQRHRLTSILRASCAT
jgi:hypothetical protein